MQPKRKRMEMEDLSKKYEKDFKVLEQKFKDCTSRNEYSDLWADIFLKRQLDWIYLLLEFNLEIFRPDGFFFTEEGELYSRFEPCREKVFQYLSQSYPDSDNKLLTEFGTKSFFEWDRNDGYENSTFDWNFFHRLPFAPKEDHAWNVDCGIPLFDPSITPTLLIEIGLWDRRGDLFFFEPNEERLEIMDRSRYYFWTGDFSEKIALSFLLIKAVAINIIGLGIDLFRQIFPNIASQYSRTEPENNSLFLSTLRKVNPTKANQFVRNVIKSYFEIGGYSFFEEAFGTLEQEYHFISAFLEEETALLRFLEDTHSNEFRKALLAMESPVPSRTREFLDDPFWQQKPQDNHVRRFRRGQKEFEFSVG